MDKSGKSREVIRRDEEEYGDGGGGWDKGEEGGKGIRRNWRKLKGRRRDRSYAWFVLVFYSELADRKGLEKKN